MGGYSRRGGVVLFSALRLRVREGKFRERRRFSRASPPPWLTCSERPTGSRSTAEERRRHCWQLHPGGRAAAEILRCTLIMSDHPHILLLVDDEHRPDVMSAEGNPHIRMPTLDRDYRAGHLLSVGVHVGAGVRAGAAELPDRPVRAPQRLHRLRHTAAERRAHHARPLRQLRLQPHLRRQDALCRLRPDARLAGAHRARHRIQHAAHRGGAPERRPPAPAGHRQVAHDQGDHQRPRRQGPPHAARPVHRGRGAAVSGRVFRRRTLRPPRRGAADAGRQPVQPPLPLPVPGGSVQLLPAPRRALRRGSARALRLRRLLQGARGRGRDLARGATRHRRLLRHDRMGGPPVWPRHRQAGGA